MGLLPVTSDHDHPCRVKGKSCETIFDSRNQRLACRRSLSHKSGMHYGSRRVSTDAQHTALQHAVLPYASCTIEFITVYGLWYAVSPLTGGTTYGQGTM